MDRKTGSRTAWQGISYQLAVMGDCDGLLTLPQFVTSVGLNCFMDRVSVLALVLSCPSLFILVC